MGKKRKGEIRGEVVDFRVRSITSPPADVFAVYDEGNEEYVSFPVILFAVGDAVVRTGSQEREEVMGLARGMVSNLGGMVLVEDATDMKFIGYWRKGVQSLGEFLEEHEIELPPDFDDDLE
jgi:hypothetical protein